MSNSDRVQGACKKCIQKSQKNGRSGASRVVNDSARGVSSTALVSFGLSQINKQGIPRGREFNMIKQ